MSVPKIYESEYRFCLILWKNEPVSSTDLVKICSDELGWKRTTTYTVIKRLSERGVLKNDDGTVFYGKEIRELAPGFYSGVREKQKAVRKGYRGDQPDHQ